MAILIGIDEAGYGPVLGPLVVVAAALEVPDELAAADLWQVLADGVTAGGRGTARRVHLADSKKVHQGHTNLAPLERHTLATCPLPLPLDFATFVNWLGIPPGHLADGEPWHADPFAALPLAADLETVTALRAAFAGATAAAGVRLCGIVANLAQPWRFNRLVAATDNKAAVLWALAAEAVERAVELACAAPVQDPRVFVTMDKQGGRTFYAQLLRETWPMAPVEALSETAAASRYRLEIANRPVELVIREKAETHALPVALASMYAKYVRELCLAQFNRWWSARAAQLPATAGVAPTAGYWTDYHRWAAEMAPLLKELDLPPALFVRSR